MDTYIFLVLFRKILRKHFICPIFYVFKVPRELHDSGIITNEKSNNIPVCVVQSSLPYVTLTERKYYFKIFIVTRFSDQ